MPSKDYLPMARESLRHLWWDTLLAGDHSWMDAHDGYMYVAVYLAGVSVLASAARHCT